MKNKIVLLIFCLILLIPLTYAQNIGIGTIEPTNKLHVLGNLLINEPYVSTNTAPTPAQTQTLVNNVTLNFLSTDSTGRIYDPGGAAGDYLSNLTAYSSVPLTTDGSMGTEVTLESVGLGTGDSLIIRATSSSTSDVFLRIGNGYSTPGKWIFSSTSLYVIFKSNSDANNGSGFSLLFKRLFSNTSSQNNLTGYAGKAFFFDSKSGALRVGYINNKPRGLYSFASGYVSTASGNYSMATGFSSIASGHYSTAMGSSTSSGDYSVSFGSSNNASGAYSFAGGSFAQAVGGTSFSFGYQTIATGDFASSFSYLTTASGFASVAMGRYTIASEEYSTAMGNHTTASGIASTAMGDHTTASGIASTAMGDHTTASGANSLALGQYSDANGLASTAFGYNTNATGLYSTAFGHTTDATGEISTSFGKFTLASGIVSTAFGRSTTANGNYSTAMGNYVSTSNHDGAFALGDNSTSTVMQSFVANGFRSRFAGGYRLLSNSAANLGVVLLPDGTSWGVISDVRLKENFLPIDGEQLLQKIACMPLSTWNYIAQSDKSSRHYGPMAQDFYAAFGKDDLGTIGCDTLINQQDFLGINLIAIQALEKRTSAIEELRNENIALKSELFELRKMIESLSTKLNEPELMAKASEK